MILRGNGKKIFFFAAAAVVFLCVFLCGCTDSNKEPAENRSIFAMDTYMTLTAYGENGKEALDKAEQEIHALDALLSTGLADSEITELNNSGYGVLSKTSVFLLKQSIRVNEMTNGAFNPLVYPLMKAWGFTDRNFRVPDAETIERNLSLLDLNDMDFNEDTSELRFLKPGMMIDFGGIAKGYTSSRIMEIFRENGVKSGVVSLGGNVQVLGTKPDGTNYQVAVQDPEQEDAFLGVVSAADEAVITSGGYERFFEEDGMIYHHILDPETGYPADQDLLSVTIVSADGTLADGLSTALFVLGKDRGEQVWRANRELFDVIFLSRDHELYVSEGLRDRFSSQSYPVHYILSES